MASNGLKRLLNRFVASPNIEYEERSVSYKQETFNEPVQHDIFQPRRETKTPHTNDQIVPILVSNAYSVNTDRYKDGTHYTAGAPPTTIPIQ